MPRVISDLSRLKSGNGQIDPAHPEKYRPWILTRDFKHCFGNRRIVYDEYEGRTIHLLSNLEYYYYLTCRWNYDSVINIFDQVPLNVLETNEIAKTNGFRHPKNQITNDEYFMTTDFVLIVEQNNELKYIARAIKPEAKLKKNTVVNKLEIENLYWKSQGIDWRVITDKDFDETFVWNLQLINERKQIIAQKEHAIFKDAAHVIKALHVDMYKKIDWVKLLEELYDYYRE